VSRVDAAGEQVLLLREEFGSLEGQVGCADVRNEQALDGNVERDNGLFNYG
jgi:hypothetical protein